MLRLGTIVLGAHDVEQAAEIERLVALGAERVAWDSYPADPDFVVLADPEGNRFCVVDASHGCARPISRPLRSAPLPSRGHRIRCATLDDPARPDKENP